MINYFSYISYTLTLNNKLEKAVYEYLKTREREVILEIDLGIFKAEVLLKISELNAEYHRCKSIKAGWWDCNRSSKYHDWQLEGFSQVHFFLYASKK